MKTHKLIKYIYVLIVCIALPYLMLAFVFDEININKWDELVRFYYIILTIGCVLFGLITAYLFDKLDEQIQKLKNS